ncbi:LppX_LprAFG lipoprotein [[Mycobacterium] nativiensis]|uniref:LppX_LprAFG lipoprotein n=1 Tax=[Mycobacterium] nativiensis TaxID=2855503 RepID=A0ABU5XXR8_9MYCO|nr:LppX_LprAFG lipoprotein [Mycolicibacter sp. MYC340]MEB3032775.1 LppX_LprAFG lipoprotein [Mycolicibacter sp. MYC340]
MRRLSAVLTVASAAAALVAACSPSPSQSVPSSSAASPSPATASSTVVAEPTSTSHAPTSPTASKKASEPLPDAAAILKESSAVTAELDSVHLAMSVTGNIENLPVTALDGGVTRVPDAAAKGYAKIAYRGAPAYVEFVVFGGDLYVSGSPRRWVDYGPAGNFYDAATILSPDTGLADLLTDFVDPEASGRETIDGVETVRVTGEVSAAAAKKIVPQLKASKRTSCTVWIQETGAHQLVQLQLASGADDAVQMTFSNWNEPVTVGKPRM